MTAVELAREAARIVPPAGATVAIAIVDEQLHHRAAFLVNGRIRSAPVGPSFTKPRDACAFVDILNGNDRPASRPRPDDFAGIGVPASEDARTEPETPDSQLGASVTDPIAVPPAAVGVRTCEICHQPLPAGSRRHRRTDTPAGRRALARRDAKSGRADAQGVDAVVPLSRPSDAVPVSTPRPGEEVWRHFASSPARDAAADLFPESSASGVPTLGL